MCTNEAILTLASWIHIYFEQFRQVMFTVESDSTCESLFSLALLFIVLYQKLLSYFILLVGFCKTFDPFTPSLSWLFVLSSSLLIMKPRTVNYVIMHFCIVKCGISCCSQIEIPGAKWSAGLVRLCSDRLLAHSDDLLRVLVRLASVQYGNVHVVWI